MNMLTLKTLYWSNCFSYGENNELALNKNRVTQLLGKNGAGKSSIPLILQEILYNKNSKGIKKAGVLNRHTDSKEYSIAVDFDLNGDEYFFSIVRKGATTKTELLCNDEDIGAHTATATYKQVALLLGMDFTTFCQLVYQSANSSLEFLTATDTTRKKFLISLLNLGEYTDKEQKIKKIYSKVHTQLTAAQASVDTIASWLDKNNLIDTETKKLQEVPIEPEKFREDLAKYQQSTYNVKDTNSKILVNNKVKEALDKVDQDINSRTKPKEPSYDLSTLIESKAKIRAIHTTAATMKAKLTKLEDKCPTCMSSIDEQRVLDLIRDQDNILNLCIVKETEVADKRKVLSLQLKALREFDSLTESQAALHTKYDQELEVDFMSTEDLESKSRALRHSIKVATDNIEAIRKANQKAEVHNEKVKYVLEQTDKYIEELEEKTKLVDSLQRRCYKLDILKKAFGTKGLVAYKIESMIKDLEVLINKYLVEMSDGKFSLAFVVVGDKLNVDILDGGIPISISALSSGELAKVNVSTLLAIRKLMNTLSNTKLNLLFLDEVTTVLDDEGKEKLVEVLNKEEDINAFIVSHGWQHPLVDKIEIVKVNDSSTVEI